MSTARAAGLSRGPGRIEVTAMPRMHARTWIVTDFFHRFAHRVAGWVGSPWCFLAALTTIVIWGVVGPLFSFSDTWQLVINTATTIVTFLMVFLIQNTQNRDALALHLKLDELIRSVGRARNSLVDLEDLSDEELEQLQQEFQLLRQRQGCSRPRH